MKDLQALEAAIGTGIPASLLEVINHPPVITRGNNRFLREVKSGSRQTMTLEKIKSVDEMLDDWENLKNDEYFSEHPILPFGETLGNPIICIGIGENNQGEIYVFDWDFDATRVAGSMEEFFAMLF